MSSTIILEVTFREDDVAPADMLYAAESALEAEPIKVGWPSSTEVRVSRVRVHTCPTATAAAAEQLRANEAGCAACDGSGSIWCICGTLLLQRAELLDASPGTGAGCVPRADGGDLLSLPASRHPTPDEVDAVDGALGVIFGRRAPEGGA